MDDEEDTVSVENYAKIENCPIDRLRFVYQKKKLKRHIHRPFVTVIGFDIKNKIYY
jgi:hypothetical protein